MEEALARRDRLARQMEELLPSWSLAKVVVAIQALRGVAAISAMTLVAEIGDFRRFANPRQLMAYFGLVPGERSSGQTVRRGGITKTGNAHARRALIEGAWAYRMRARIGRHKVDRIEALVETMELLSDPQFIQALKEHRAGQGKQYDLAELDAEMSA